MSSPLSNVEENRRKHLHGLSELLESPVCILRAAMLPFFEDTEYNLKLRTVESLEKASNILQQPASREDVRLRDPDASYTAGH